MYPALLISLKTALIASILSFFSAVFLARKINGLGRSKLIFDSLLTLPLVMPPSVLGLLLLIIFGKRSFIGQFLAGININLIFSPQALILAAFVVSLPLMYKTASAAFSAVDINMIHVASCLGFSRSKIFWQLIIPNSKASLLAGFILSFARSLGEFGATIMIAGNIEGETRTMALAVYTAVQSGNRDLAYKLLFVMCLISFASILALNFIAKHFSRDKSLI